jgi:hypothetical protein
MLRPLPSFSPVQPPGARSAELRKNSEEQPQLAHPVRCPYPTLQSPGLASWEILSRPCGTTHWHMLTQDYVLGYSQPSLRDSIG